MSEKLLGLREHPFAAGHDPRFIHLTPDRDEALARLRHGLGGGEPFLLVTGEPGIGKNSLVRQALETQDTVAAFVPKPPLDPRDLLEEICLRFEISVPKGASKPQAMARLERHLTEFQTLERTPVLVVDEAHDATPELLEELRLLSNLEIEGRPMLQVILMGLPEFERRLGGPEMVRLRQRVATHVRIGSLSAQETEGYIHTRVAAAGGDGPTVFPAETCLEIHRLARGVPRAINTIAEEALLKASRESATSVAPAHVQASAADSWLRSVSDVPTVGSGASAAAERPRAAEMYPEIDPSQIPNPDAKEWISRFVDPDRPLQIGGQILAERAAEASRREWEEENGPEDSETEDHRAPAPRARPRPRPRARRRGRERVPVATLSVIVLGAAGTFLGVRWMAQRQASSGSRVASAPSVTQAPAAEEPATSSNPVTRNPATQNRTMASKVASPMPAAEVTPPKPAARRGIEAGTYLNPERAQAERTLLAETTGMPVQVIEGQEDGAAIYRVVIGSYGSRRRARAALNDLVGRGLLEQARIIALPTEESTTP